MPEQQPSQHELTVMHPPAQPTVHLESCRGILVSCRLATGEAVYVPLHELFRFFVQELRRTVTLRTGHHG